MLIGMLGKRPRQSSSVYEYCKWTPYNLMLLIF